MPTATYIHLPAAPFISMPEAMPAEHSEDVFVWRVPIFPGRDFALQLVPLLTRDEVEKSLRLIQEEDRQRFLVGRGVLRILLGRYLNVAPGSVSIGTGADQKPLLTGAQADAIHFNVSHSGDWILIGFAASPLGVDIERIDPAFHFEEVRTHYFTREELPLTATAAGFYETWTRKESLIKAFGSGLNDQLLSFSTTPGEHDLQAVAPSMKNDWTIVSFLMNDQYAIGIASAAGRGVLHLIDFQLPSPDVEPDDHPEGQEQEK